MAIRSNANNSENRPFRSLIGEEMWLSADLDED